ncbi:hypothetical protein FB45DRAFT_478502 [Roridomyces roridus]|uniref:Uncharacterized protein n=1 Tax=Roridomyces roridus TaxID=1738132 RepID=A0AAD7BZS8_9AGAR|nr:hypothetical protein FB45DRAFT_478502 [Roridomyces roridus]
MQTTLKTLVPVLSLAFLVALAGAAQEAVTLWQFGQGRLLEASLTLPLIPLGTAIGGSETTYLYQALNNALTTTTDASGVTTTVQTPSATPRTIIASASGWFEQFDDGDIICGLVNPTFGHCLVGGSMANSGSPTPEVIAIDKISVFIRPVTPKLQNSVRHRMI